MIMHCGDHFQGGAFARRHAARPLTGAPDELLNPELLRQVSALR